MTTVATSKFDPNNAQNAVEVCISFLVQRVQCRPPELTLVCMSTDRETVSAGYEMMCCTLAILMARFAM